MFYRMLLLTGMCLVIVSGLAEGQAPKPWANKLFDADVKDFGVCKQGDELKHKFKITNIYQTPLDLKLRITCDCTSGMLSSKTLQPGEVGYLEVNMDSNRFMGAKVVTIFVTAQNGKYFSEAKLLVQANRK
jgi:hypothetical protein